MVLGIDHIHVNIVRIIWTCFLDVPQKSKEDQFWVRSPQAASLVI